MRTNRTTSDHRHVLAFLLDGHGFACDLFAVRVRAVLPDVRRNGHGRASREAWRNVVQAEEDLVHWQVLVAAPGEEWGGRARYAAAMHFFQKGALDAQALEIYRICARLDQEDPLDVMRRWHVGEDWIARIEAARSGSSEADATRL